MPSQLAVGAETDPLRRARQLQRSWERLLADGALSLELPPGATAGLRPTIVESWRRSLATGLDPTDLLAPIEADESEMLERWFEHPLGSLTHGLMEQLGKVAEESRSMVVVTNASALVLHRVGDESLKERAAEMNLVEGAGYSEAADGTNGIGTAPPQTGPFRCSPSSTSTNAITNGSAPALRCTTRYPAESSRWSTSRASVRPRTH